MNRSIKTLRTDPDIRMSFVDWIFWLEQEQLLNEVHELFNFFKP